MKFIFSEIIALVVESIPEDMLMNFCPNKKQYTQLFLLYRTRDDDVDG